MNGLASERGISAPTEKRVREYAARRGYVPSRHALRVSVKAPRRETYGLLVESHLCYSHLNEAFDLFSSRLGEYPDLMEIVVCRPEKIVEGLTEFAARRVGRFIHLGKIENPPPVDQDAMRALLPQFKRVVRYNYNFTGAVPPADVWQFPHVTRVGVNRRQAYEALGRHLAELGHHRVAIMSAARGETSTLIHAWLEAAGLEAMAARPPGLPGNVGVDKGRELGSAAIRAMREDKVTAIHFGDDLEAAAAMRWMNGAGVRIPDDVSVTGFNGHIIASFLPTPLTTLAMPVERMVEASIQALFSDAPGGDRPFGMDLRVGASSGPPPREAYRQDRRR